MDVLLMPMEVEVYNLRELLTLPRFSMMVYKVFHQMRTTPLLLSM